MSQGHNRLAVVTVDPAKAPRKLVTRVKRYRAIRTTDGQLTRHSEDRLVSRPVDYRDAKRSHYYSALGRAR